MKVLGQKFEKDGKGSATLIAEESEDLWHLYNLVALGDSVSAMTYRKVQRDEGKGSDNMKLKLTIEVKNVEYDAEGKAIRFAGQNVEECEWVKMGAHHTIEIELNEKITIIKDCWDYVFRQQLEDATDVHKSAEVAVVLMEAKDTGIANFHLITNVLAKDVLRIQHPLPKKKGPSTTQLDKAVLKYFAEVYEGVKAHINLGLVKCVVLAGPGSTKDDFGKWMQTTAMQEGNSDIVQKKGIFVSVTTSVVHKQALRELLADDQVSRRIANTKAGQHLKALEELQKRLANDPNRACYGPQQVKIAIDMGAVDTLLVSDSLFRNASVAVRREYVDLVCVVKTSGATSHVLSSGHVTGQQLDQLAGVAALLRFPVEELEDLEDLVCTPEPSSLEELLDPRREKDTEDTEAREDRPASASKAKAEAKPAKAAAKPAVKQAAAKPKTKKKQGAVLNTDDDWWDDYDYDY
mmetsp:Transcript_26600/g.58407  ORF Transcript_26600/g.58407 Transcript_26600/m.58407 type:complete len:463 (-) Transcript_26600:209-1597(-)